ncbi:MAG: O-antigen ligase family protein [Ignavibacteriales bacterium]|nr:O-antigen ligase family protein [Ignavibacteriales bacterium]
MNYFLIIIISTIAFLFDNGVYLSNHTPKNFALITLVPLLLTFYFVWFLIKNKKQAITFSIIEALLVLRLVWMVVTNPQFLTHPSNLSFWILLSLTLLTLLTRQIINAKGNDTPIKYFIRTIWVTGIIQALIGYWQLLISPPYAPQFMKTPLAGTIGTANGYGLFLALSLAALAIEFIMQKEKIYRMILLFFIVLLLTALFINGSRGAMLGLFASAMLIVIFLIITKEKASGKLSERKKYLYVITGLILLTITTTVLFLLIIQNSESTKGRLFVWKVSLPMLVEHPAIGVGQGKFAIEYLNYQAKFFNRSENRIYFYKAANLKQAHNEFFQAFCETGIFGGIIFLAIWLFALWQLFKNIGGKSGTNTFIYIGSTAMLLTILVHGLVDTTLHVLPISVAAYIILGLIPTKKFTYELQLRRFNLRFLVVSLLIIFTSIVLYKSINQYQGYYHWKKGVQAVGYRSWYTAEIQYQKALEKLEEQGELQFHLGSAFVMDGNYVEGINLLKESLSNFNDRNIYLSISYGYLKTGGYGEAEKYAKKALSMFPDHLAPHLLLGEIYFYQKRIEESKASLLKCINRQTEIQSYETGKISNDAQILWNKFYK